MSNILNPLEKEVLIKLYRRSPGVKLGDFCRINNVSDAAFKSWLKKYDTEGLEGLYRSKKTPELLPDGVDKTAENYKRELIKARLELERIKKNYIRIQDDDGKLKEFVSLSAKNMTS
ncbi:MAG: helix-turn-helix domain containing protein [Clostridiales Family XIII bacterium]|nr:helix-turn-helix domain containing protein [Clostridiales Family XIII bacterium]